ncbi:flagellar M-ring protein [Actinoplanes sp. SE50]|uniref:flagellar basal-body MS-ring/collar protein FliF n=1 Tax=unclassified Actinoplanes TaxID=2626549 RepID=UPI00023EDEE9|nr:MULTISPECIES: flagellar basal-body MS-ring/collar protein FliF [unclassified Actinoplanes]AEV88784.1 Flagellar M-ring protein [Actinoplanes sp. SE50/110]ATO87190.1 flagellar M-ring protein [Actinoplanes sp. SE50]SLM04608.1 flagellar M-ring protein FliF [Actinoplanes sp. SE50/110]
MTDRLPAPVRRITDTFKSFTPGQKAVTIFAIIALVVGGYFFATWAAKPSYAILFNNLSTKDASAIVESLQKSNTSYELANDGQTIMVPRDQVNALRLQLSGQGLPNDEGTGYSLLDQQGITTSDFMQHANYQRALEGELAKTIKSIDGVEAATVHLVLPQKDVFADNAAKPTASVLVASKSTTPLSTDQVQAIVHLVASSVEGLDPTQVTVAGADGKILSTGGGAAVATGGDSGSDAQTVEFQNRMNASLQAMLDRLVGSGHSVVTTTADLDFDQTTTQSKTYSSDPSLPSLSETSSSETYSGSGGNNGGVLGPDNIQVPNGAGSNGQYANKNDARQNALNEVQEVRRKAPGSIRRLNVAVLLDSTTAASIDPTQVQQLVSSAAGIDATRGDSIAVSAMPFDNSAQQAAKDELAAAAAADRQNKQLTLVKTGALAFVVLMLFFLAWRASRRAKRRQQLTAEEKAHLEEMQAALDAQRQAELEATQAMHAAAMIEGGVAVEERDEAREERTREIEEMVKEKPDEMATLLRGWMSADATHR